MKDAVPIDPIELKLIRGTFTTTLLKGVFGALRDASPDYWGRRVIDKRSGVLRLSEIDYLLESPDDRAGALGFGCNAEPPAPRRRFNQTIALPGMQEPADRIIADEEAPAGADAEQVDDLLRFGTSMGGARPKAILAATHTPITCCRKAPVSCSNPMKPRPSSTKWNKPSEAAGTAPPAESASRKRTATGLQGPLYTKGSVYRFSD